MAGWVGGEGGGGVGSHRRGPFVQAATGMKHYTDITIDFVLSYFYPSSYFISRFDHEGEESCLYNPHKQRCVGYRN